MLLNPFVHGAGAASSVVFLLNANPSVGLNDESAVATTVTAVGGASVSSPGGLWSTGYIDFDGSSQAVACSIEAEHDISSSISASTNWTCEMYVKADSTASDGVLIQKGMPASGGDGKPGWRVMMASGGAILFDVGFTTGSWARWATSSGIGTSAVLHLSVQIVSGVPVIHFDGVAQSGSFTVGSAFTGINAENTNKALDIGSLSTDSTNGSRSLFFNGQMGGIRISAAQARYGSGSFTPPSGYLTN